MGFPKNGMERVNPDQWLVRKASNGWFVWAPRDHLPIARFDTFDDINRDQLIDRIADDCHSMNPIECAKHGDLMMMVDPRLNPYFQVAV